MKYGHFSHDHREFIITRPDTPAPWVNYLTNGRMSALISHTGGGYSFYRSPKDSRITRWRYNSLPVDRPGRTILLRDRANGIYWSPTWQPTTTPVKDFECRHGLYYTRISSVYENIRTSVLYFIADDDVEIWRVTLENLGFKKKELDCFAFAELCLGHALIDLINQPNDHHFNEVNFDREQQILYATKRYWVRYHGATVKQPNEAWDKTVFFASSLPVSGWDGSKDQFIGRWRSEANPIAVERGRCFNSEITARDAIAALQMPVELEADEKKEFVLLLGIADKAKSRLQSEKQVKRYRSLEQVDSAFKKHRSAWTQYIDTVQVETPDDDMNTMLNVWNPYQTSVTFLFSRDASYYHGGLLFGRGYRDSCQDILGPVMAKPYWVRDRILEMSTFQFKNGSTFHLYHPLSRTGERTGHSDTPLWLPLAVMVYIKETGDHDFLNTETTFYDGGKASLLQHLVRAIDYALVNLTPRQLAAFGPGDWNDTLDQLGRQGKGESVWVTQFLVYILGEMAGLCRFTHNKELAEQYEQEVERLSAVVNELCWDGEWYIRGTTDSGKVIGSSKNEQGQIFLNTQSWAVISGIAQGERAETCMASVQTHLDTDKGPKILHPPYTEIDEHIGLATRCVPGKKGKRSGIQSSGQLGDSCGMPARSR